MTSTLLPFSPAAIMGTPTHLQYYRDPSSLPSNTNEMNRKEEAQVTFHFPSIMFNRSTSKLNGLLLSASILSFFQTFHSRTDLPLSRDYFSHENLQLSTFYSFQTSLLLSRSFSTSPLSRFWLVSSNLGQLSKSEDF